jgi:trehalose 6-phosphate synthase/phosphatase
VADKKLIVASVRLPVSVQRKGAEWEVEQSPGGLATALRSLADQREFTWIGWPGTEVPEDEHETVRDRLSAHAQAAPVFLSAEEKRGFYDEFANRVLWPLFHNMPGKKTFDAEAWRLYRSVNQRFADAIHAQARPGDAIWVHDYQLMLVPQLLRERGLDCPIGFFLHIPFPSSETYRTLPVREDILRGVLGSDLIGFHAYEYVSHFRNACLRVLGLESEPESIVLPTHHARLGVLPIGIEPDEIAAMSRSDEANEQYWSMKTLYRGRKVIAGVDRLDYTKGLPQKLLAFEELLHDHPELRDQVVFIQVASPSRTRVVEYQRLQREIDELAGRINGRYGTLNSTPLVYINQHMSRETLTALYRLADVALVTPLRDGMNLVCLEYIAARRDEPGALILSEFTGAASCLSGALLVNPYNPSHMARVLAQALEQGPDPKQFHHMREFVDTNTSVAWAERFLQRLEATHDESRARLQRLRVDRIEQIKTAKRPLMLIDYDGTLVPLTLIPAQATPGKRVRALLADLARLATVYVVSGRPASDLDEWLGDLPVGLVCEHGLSIKHAGDGWSEDPHVDGAALRAIVDPVFRDFTERTPGSTIEYKRASIAWHYRGADPKFGAWRAKELRTLLDNHLSGQPYSVLSGSRVIEVRHVQMSKGHAAAALLELHKDRDLVICIGDDRTDEEMFDAVLRWSRAASVVCRVGGLSATAPYMVESVSELLDQLERLRDIWQDSRQNMTA